MNEIEKLDLLEKLTVVIPTYNRQAFALRNMHYWSGKSAKIIVLDGTGEAIDSNDLINFHSNIEYYHLPIPMNERLQFALGKVRTPYSMMCGDDEFMLPAGVAACIKFLDSNEDYAQCGGRSVGFAVKDTYIDLYEVKPIQRHHRIEQATIFERIKYHIENFTPSTIYSVHRSESFSKAVFAAIKYPYSNGGYTTELIFELISAGFGKSRILPSAVWMRSSENKPVHNETWNRKLTLPEWHDDATYAEEVQKMYQVLTDTICSMDPNLDRTQTSDFIIKTVNGRLDKSDRPVLHKKRAAFLQKQVDLTKKRKTSIKSRFNKRLLSFNRSIKRKFISSAPRLASIFFANYFHNEKNYSYKLLETQGEIKISDMQEFNNTWETVLAFHRKSFLDMGK